MCCEATRTPEPWLRGEKKRLIIEIQTVNNGPGSMWLDVTDPLLRNPRISIGCWIVWSDGITEGDEGGGKYTHMYETLQYIWGGVAQRSVLLMVNHTAPEAHASWPSAAWMNECSSVWGKERNLQMFGHSRINVLHLNILCKLHRAPLRTWEGVGGGWGGRQAQRRSCVGSPASGPQSDASGKTWTFVRLYINTPPTSLTISVRWWPLMWKMAAVTWGCSLVAHSPWRGASCDSGVWCQCDTAAIIKAAGYNVSARRTR